MKNELSYIDDIIKKGVEGAKIKPSSTWEQFNKKLESSQNIPSQTNINKFTNFIKSKLFIASTAIISIIVGIFVYSNTNNKELKKQKTVFENRITDTTTVKTKAITPETPKKEKIVTKKDIKLKKEHKKNIKNKDTKKDVIIKVKVPVHKTVIKRKKIFIKNKDSIK